MSNVKFENHVKEVGTIYETYEFSLFKMKVGNRKVDEVHVNKLIESISEKDLKVPIEVDENFNIVDGQHRFFAYKKLNRGFRFFIQNNVVEVEDIQMQNNLNKRWNLEDYMDSFTSIKNQHYIALKSFIERHDIPITVGLIAFGFDHRTFKDGKFKIQDIEKVEELMSKTNMIMNNWIHQKDRKLSIGIISFLKTHPDTDISMLIQRMVKYPSKMYSCTKTSEYIKMFKDIYNFHTRVQRKLAHA